MIDALLLVLSLAIILFACEVFTNAVEWFGRTLGWHQGAVGSILAAVGTAMPETMVPIIALLFGSGHAREEVGIGAILGAPLMLSCLTLPLIGGVTLLLASAKRRSFYITADRTFFLNDLLFFTFGYGLAVLAAVLPWREARYGVVVLLLASYGVYVWRTLRSAGEATEANRPLFFTFGAPHRRESPGLFLVVAQVVVALVGIIVAAHLFVGALVSVSAKIGIPPLLLSVVLTPIATELPEKFNSLLWISRKQDTLAIGNITGAMVFQSTVPVAIGVAFTEWQLAGPALGAVVVTLGAAAVLWIGALASGRIHPVLLMGNVVLYVGYLVYVLRGV